jgi:phytoene synthase
MKTVGIPDGMMQSVEYVTKPTMATPADYAECRRVMFAASRNYSFACRFFPRRALRHVEALYAFLRIGDDRVDESHQGYESCSAAIEDWEQAYRQAFEMRRSSHPVMRAYLNTALECGIPPETMVPYFRSMREDLAITRYADFAGLMHYMEGSAIAVGRAMTRILGVRHPCSFEAIIPRADSLSVAMQLSNFLRDVGQDWHRGRVYLPGEDLARFGVTEDEIAAGRVTEHFVAMMEFEIERAEGYYRHAVDGVLRLRNGRWGIMAGFEVYRGIHDHIRRSNYDVFTRRAGTTRAEKLLLALRAWWRVYVLKG